MKDCTERMRQMQQQGAAGASGTASTAAVPELPQEPVHPAPLPPPAEPAQDANMQALLPVKAETRVPGLQYSVSLDSAKILGWKVSEMAFMGRSGVYVLERAAPNGEHLFLTTPNLPPALLANNSPVITNLDATLALAQPNAGDFVADFISRKWFENIALFGPMGPQITAAITELGTDQAFLAASAGQRALITFLKLIKLFNEAFAKDGRSLEWAGHPTIPEQLLTSI